MYRWKLVLIRRAKLGQIQGGRVAEGQPRFDKGGVAIIFFTFYALKIEHFRVFTYAIKKGLFLRILRYKKVPFLEFLRKSIKKDSHLRISM